MQLTYLSTASRTTAFLLTSLLLVNVANAGIRAPGKYSGVVFFDRWGGCILFSGVYLMYISEEGKESLRKYNGQAIEIDALEVVQPINPGDALIKSFNVIGPARVKHNGYTVDGTKLEAQAIAIHPPFATVTLTITNRGGNPATVNSSQIGFALLGRRKSQNDPLSPSDGPSTAVITRTTVLNSHKSDGVHSYVITDRDMFPTSFRLTPHGSKTTKITFMLPQGSYQFLAGYGGGVHENYLVISNPVSIDLFK